MTHCESFWSTLELLVSLKGKKDFNSEPFNEDIEDWLNDVSSKENLQFALTSNENSEDNEILESQIDYQLIECNITQPVVKSRLEMLMGTNIARLMDRKYMLKLMSKIQQDHETKQQIRIEKRMKEELSRTKMMILNRLMPIQEAPEEIRQHSLFQLYLHCDSIMQKSRKKETKKLTRLRKSLYRMLYPQTTNSEKDDDEKEVNVYFRKITVGAENELVQLTNEEVIAYLRDQEEKKDLENGYVLRQEDYDRLHYETEAVKSLRDAKSVEEMYAKAHAIVGILYSYSDEARQNQEEETNNVKQLFPESKIIQEENKPI